MDQHTQPGDNTRVAQMLKILNSLETRTPRIILRRVDEPLTVMISERENANALVAETEIDTPCLDAQTAKLEDDLHIPIPLQEVKEEVKLSPHPPVAQMAVTTWPAAIGSQNNSNTATNLGSVSNMEPAKPQNVMKVHEDQLKQQGQTFEDVTQQQRSLLKTPSPAQTCSIYIKIEDSNRYTEAEHPSPCYSTTCVESGNTSPIDCRSESDVLNPTVVWQEQANDQQMNATEKSKEEEKIIGNVTESDFPICYNDTIAHQQNSTASVPVGEISVDNNGCYSFNVDEQIVYNYTLVNQKSATLVAMFMCDVCGLLFDDLLLLNHHKRIHSTTDMSTVTSQNSQTLSHEFQYTCDICQSCFSLASELDVHKNNIHSKNNQIQNHQESCDLSGAEHNCHLDSGKGNCDLHVGKEKDSVKLGKCEGSKKINSVNVPGTDLRNDVCNEGNSTRNLAQNAEQQFKPDYNPVKLKGFKVVKTCHECDGSGICINGSGSRSDTSSLDKPYVCNICGNTFSRYSGLWSHKRLHSSDKPYKCGVCGLAFARQSYLQNHSRIHTGEKPYKCSVCEKQFSQIPHLKNHERIHSGERPYHCQVCNKTFSRHSTLWNHRRIHTGEKPYKCDVCGSAFNQASHLKNHAKIHTGEKPYRCDICDLGFSDKFALKRHRAIHDKYARSNDPNASNNSNKNTVSDVSINTIENIGGQRQQEQMSTIDELYKQEVNNAVVFIGCSNPLGNKQ